MDALAAFFADISGSSDVSDDEAPAEPIGYVKGQVGTDADSSVVKLPAGRSSSHNPRAGEPTVGQQQPRPITFEALARHGETRIPTATLRKLLKRTFGLLWAIHLIHSLLFGSR